MFTTPKLILLLFLHKKILYHYFSKLCIALAYIPGTKKKKKHINNYVTFKGNITYDKNVTFLTTENFVISVNCSYRLPKPTQVTCAPTSNKYSHI